MGCDYFVQEGGRDGRPQQRPAGFRLHHLPTGCQPGASGANRREQREDIGGAGRSAETYTAVSPEEAGGQGARGGAKDANDDGGASMSRRVRALCANLTRFTAAAAVVLLLAPASAQAQSAAAYHPSAAGRAAEQKGLAAAKLSDFKEARAQFLEVSKVDPYW